MKVNKIPPPNIPKSHYKWAGIEVEEEEKKNELDKLVRKAYHKKYGTYNRKGEFIVFEEEAEV